MLVCWLQSTLRASPNNQARREEVTMQFESAATRPGGHRISTQSHLPFRITAPTVLILFTVVSPTLTPSAVCAELKSRPNIVLIMVDDLGYGDLGCYGQKLIATPNLDRMAREGIRFRQFYAGATVCAPSRSVLMTGQHMGHTHVRGNANQDMSVQSLRDQDVTVAEVLKEAGYVTGLCNRSLWQMGARRRIAWCRCRSTWQSGVRFFLRLSQSGSRSQLLP